MKLEDLEILVSIEATIGTLISKLSELDQDVSRIAAWIEKVEGSGILPGSYWAQSSLELARDRLEKEISEIKIMLSDSFLAPDSEELLTHRLETLNHQLQNLKNVS